MVSALELEYTGPSAIPGGGVWNFLSKRLSDYSFVQKSNLSECKISCYWIQKPELPWIVLMQKSCIVFCNVLPKKCIFEFIIHPWDANTETYSHRYSFMGPLQNL